MGDTNIPSQVATAIVYIMLLDDLQKGQGSGGVGTHKYEDWHWTHEESDYFSLVRTNIENWLEPYINKKVITTEQRDYVKLQIKELRAYCSWRTGGHRLLLKVAAFGDEHDWTVANIKLGTPQAKKASKGKSDSPALIAPEINISKYMLGQVEVKGRNPNTPTKSALPKGMKFLKFYYISGATPPRDNNIYKLYGNAKKGKCVITFDGIDTTGENKVYVFIVARYESNKGELGPFSAMISSVVIV
jgi:hypothetical protein